MKKQILLIDDDPDLCSYVARIVQTDAQEYDLKVLHSAREALTAITSGSLTPDVILCDLQMPELDGISFFRAVKPQLKTIPFIFVTAHASLDTSISAMREGAVDYLIKPLRAGEFKLAIDRSLRLSKIHEENESLRTQIKQGWQYENILGKSPAMQRMFHLIGKVADTNATVLLRGESGTGKELVTKAIHAKSSRRDHPFVAINCGAIPAELLESELFGHAKGSFTGANQRKDGLFVAAHGGTLFLDEIGDMPLALQVKLLRVLQEGKVRPVGDTTERAIDVRIIAATHRDIPELIKRGEFREDLYYRLNVLPILIPALRERSEDIPLLAEHFVKKFAAAHRSTATGLAASAIKKLLGHGWPGNVRELENILERSVILAQQDQIEAEDLFLDQGPQNIVIHEKTTTETPAAQPVDQDFFSQIDETMTLQDLEKRYIRHIIKTHPRSAKEEIAQILGINRKTLYRKEKEYGFETGDLGAPGSHPGNQLSSPMTDAMRSNSSAEA